MGISRLIYGKKGDQRNLNGFMAGSCLLCMVSYLSIVLVPNAVVNLVACSICGFSVGIMWPGALSLSSQKFPSGGTAMFALLAMAGDLGGSIGPGIVGQVSQAAGDNIRAGFLPFLQPSACRVRRHHTGLHQRNS